MTDIDATAALERAHKFIDDQCTGDDQHDPSPCPLCSALHQWMDAAVRAAFEEAARIADKNCSNEFCPAKTCNCSAAAIRARSKRPC